MDNELMALMQVLSNKPYLTLKDIEVSAGIIRRQATYRIDKVNDLLRQHNAPVITIGTAKEIRLEAQSRKKLEELLQEMNQSSQYYMNKKERQIYMYLMLFMNSEYLSLSDFIDSLCVSRSTVLLDFKELTQMLEERGIRVRNNRTKGYYPVSYTHLRAHET